jgi:hypothetical protein
MRFAYNKAAPPCKGLKAGAAPFRQMEATPGIEPGYTVLQ